MGCIVWAQTVIFFAKPVSKNAGKSTIVLWITASSRIIEEQELSKPK